jgi:hypothetical protein
MIYQKIEYNNIINNIIPNTEFNKAITKLVNELNTLFMDANNTIKQTLLKNKIKTKIKKISFTDALSYAFHYSFIDNTKQSVVSDYNYDNDKEGDRTSYYKRELQIPISFYENTLHKIKKMLNSYLKPNDKHNVYAVDGTYNNTNIKNDGKLETSLNLSVYNVTDRIPIEIEFKGEESKNKEIKSFIDLIKQNKFDVNNVIFVFDRAYFSYDFINLLDKNKINYVIRIKNNCKYIDSKDGIEKDIDNKDVRIIKYKDNIPIVKKDKEKNNIDLIETIECNIITNLDIKDYTDKEIQKIYSSRWDIEIFFKLLKSNFKFSILTEHNNNTIKQYKKKYLIILINLHILRLIEFINDKYYFKKKTSNTIILNKKDGKQKVKNILNIKNDKQKINDVSNKTNNEQKNKKSKTIHKYTQKNNQSLMVKGLKMILTPIIHSKITDDNIKSYCSNYIKITKCIKGAMNPRVSKTPFTKWYVKSYSDYNKYTKIIEAFKKNNLELLNKNLKLLANNLCLINK